MTGLASMQQQRTRQRRRPAAAAAGLRAVVIGAALALLLVLLIVSPVQQAAAVRTRLRTKIFGDVTPLHSRVSTSDPANNPLSISSFLANGAQHPALLQRWTSAVEQPRAMRVEQQVILQSQQQAQAQAQAQASRDASNTNGGADPSLLEWVAEGRPASAYEPAAWNPAGDPATLGREHLTRADGSPNPHNNLESGLGVQSAALPWEYRQYSGQLQSSLRRAEPLIYTPLVVAKSADGQSAIDVTSLVNQQFQQTRLSKQPQYERTLSQQTGLAPVVSHPTDHWLPRAPVATAPKQVWEQHFLDLYAPTPPPLLAPVPPQMPKPASAAPVAGVSLLETASAAPPLPEVLRRGSRVHSLVTPLHDAQQQPVAFRDFAREEAALRRARDVDVTAPARVDDERAQELALAAVFLERDTHVEAPAISAIDVDSMPFPPAPDAAFAW